MLIALDYDDTYTRDPGLWDGFVASATASGHRVVCVTMRHPDEAVSLPCDVIYTCRRAKRPHMQRLMMHVDIWIDDSPHFILMDSAEALPMSAAADALPAGPVAAGADAAAAPARRLGGLGLYRRVMAKFPSARR